MTPRRFGALLQLAGGGVFGAGGSLAHAQSGPPYAVYDLLPHDFTTQAAATAASTLKLSILAQDQQNPSLVVFGDKKQNARMLYDAGTVKLFPDYSKLKKTAPSADDAIATASDALQRYGLTPAGGGLLVVDDVTTLTRQPAKRNGKQGKANDVLRTVHFVRELDGLPVVGATSILSVDVGKKGVVGFYRSLRPVGSNGTSVQIKNEAQATLEFNAQVAQMGIPGTLEVMSVDLVYYEQGGSVVQPAYRFLVQTTGAADVIAAFHVIIAAALQTPEPIVMSVATGDDPTFPQGLTSRAVDRPAIRSPASDVKYGRYVIREDATGWIDDAKGFGNGLKSANAFRVAFSGFPPATDEQYYWNYPYMWESTTDGIPDASSSHLGRVDIALIEGHGGPWMMTTLDGSCNFCCDTGVPKPHPSPPLPACVANCTEQFCIDLRAITGYGEFNGVADRTDYIVWQGCSVVPAPGDSYAWNYQPPATPFDVWFEMFEGLRGVYGYRTVMNIYNSVGVKFGADLGYGFQNLSAWFKETDNNYFGHKNGLNYGSAVIVTGHEKDRLYDNAGLKPPSSLTLWWQHP